MRPSIPGHCDQHCGVQSFEYQQKHHNKVAAGQRHICLEYNAHALGSKCRNMRCLSYCSLCTHKSWHHYTYMPLAKPCLLLLQVLVFLSDVPSCLLLLQLLGFSPKVSPCLLLLQLLGFPPDVPPFRIFLRMLYTHTSCSAILLCCRYCHSWLPTHPTDRLAVGAGDVITCTRTLLSPCLLDLQVLQFLVSPSLPYTMRWLLLALSSCHTTYTFIQPLCNPGQDPLCAHHLACIVQTILPFSASMPCNHCAMQLIRYAIIMPCNPCAMQSLWHAMFTCLQPLCIPGYDTLFPYPFGLD